MHFSPLSHEENDYSNEIQRVHNTVEKMPNLEEVGEVPSDCGRMIAAPLTAKKHSERERDRGDSGVHSSESA